MSDAGSNTSALESTSGVLTLLFAVESPPAMRTRPSGSAAAAAPVRGVCSSVAPDAGRAVNVFEAGSKISVLVTRPPFPVPPVISTFPPGNGTAAKFSRAVCMLPDAGSAVNVFEAGSNSSALWTIVVPLNPPAMSTRPSGSGAAAAEARGTESCAGRALNAPVAGSNTSALCSTTLEP